MLAGLGGRVVASLAIVGHLSQEAGFTVHSVLHLLHAAVGKVHVVAALCVLVVTGLLLPEVVVGIAIVNTPLELILGHLEGVLVGAGVL